MVGLVLGLAAITAVAAAVRSTWSPCGLSMLSSITPLSERARGQRFAVTANWFMAGSILGGLCLGAVAALGALALGALHLSWSTVGVLGTVAAGAAVVLDRGLTPIQFPILRRQVNERWLDQYRGWFYGVGFGWQIGVGFATYVMTAAVPLLVVLAALTQSPWVAAVIGVLFGSLRGLMVMLGRRLADPAALRVFHRRLDRLEGPARSGCILVEAAVAVAAAAMLGPVGAGAAAVVVGALLVARRGLPVSKSVGDVTAQ